MTVSVCPVYSTFKTLSKTLYPTEEKIRLLLPGGASAVKVSLVESPKRSAISVFNICRLSFESNLELSVGQKWES